MEFSIYRMKQVLKGETDKRVSEEAARALGDQMDEHGIEIASRAKEYAEEAGRKTVRAVDIRKALRG
ncbi:histone [Candidatus Nanohalovita haloferacivicina]|uniref:histone n=1 Tax=Candidatus Nanohalovita haloferacivicina TaxID=2978046 RepID=UPI00325FB823|nr:Archaeal histone H3/H4 [Candidatus Nanohalobia archaeon BNXNv]